MYLDSSPDFGGRRLDSLRIRMTESTIFKIASTHSFGTNTKTKNPIFSREIGVRRSSELRNAATFFPRRRCAMTVAGLLALSVSYLPSYRLIGESGIDGKKISRLQLRVSFRIFPSMRGRALTEFPFHPDVIFMTTGHQRQTIEKNKFLEPIYNATERLSRGKHQFPSLNVEAISMWANDIHLTKFLEIIETGIPPDRCIDPLLYQPGLDL